jgi:F420-0:gamma-glutamyl ligase
MIVTAIKTRKVLPNACTVLELLDEALSSLPDKSVLVVTSKVVSLCEGRIRSKNDVADLQKLIREEAELYMPDAQLQHGYTFTIVHNMLTPNSGIDESNANGSYVLFPADPQQSANDIRQHLCERFGRDDIGVVIVDSDFLPLRWGSIGLAVAYSGIEPVRSYADQVDLFGRPLRLTRANVVDSLATTAAFIMGEGAEQTPMALLEDIPVVFTHRDPTAEELAARYTPPDEDSFGPLLTAAEWLPGGRGPVSPRDIKLAAEE